MLEASELRKERLDDSAQLARKRWRMIALGSDGGGGGGGGDSGSEVGAIGEDANRKAWSRGEEYVRLWKEGVRPDYSPALTEPISPPVDPLDFMGTRDRSHSRPRP